MTAMQRPERGSQRWRIRPGMKELTKGMAGSSMVSNIAERRVKTKLGLP